MELESRIEDLEKMPVKLRSMESKLKDCATMPGKFILESFSS